MKVKLLITSIAAAAVVAVPVAGAAEYGAGGPGAGGPVIHESELSGHAFVGGPGAGGPVLASDIFGYEPIGGPGAGGPIVNTGSAVAADGFDWIAAAVGMAFAIGLGLVATGLLLRSRRRSTLAMPQH